MAAFTLEHLATLEEAIATGALRVRYADKEVQYRDLPDMLRTLDIMRAELGLTNPSQRRKFAEHNKGLK